MSRISWKDISRDFNKQFTKINLLSWKKGCTTYKHSDALQSYTRFTGSNQVNGLEITFVAGVTKINLKNLKT